MKLIIFDCDGTLIDSQGSIVGAMDETFNAQGLVPPSREAVLSIVGLSLEEAMQVLHPDGGAEGASELANAYRHHFIMRRARGEGERDPLYPGTKEMLAALNAREDVLMGVATGKARRGVDHMVAVHALHDLFVTIQTADVAPSKPHPGMILQALAETGAEPANTVMIGDTSYDMDMARAAGVAALGVSWGYHDQATLLQCGARRVMHGFDELLPALGELWDDF